MDRVDDDIDLDGDEGDEEVDPQIKAAVDAEVQRLRAEGKLVRIEPRCKICREPHLREMVNGLLAQGLTRAAIQEALDHSINVARRAEGKDPITYFNIRNHELRHFNVNAASRVVYENILRKHESDVDFGKAVGARVNAFSYLETMMVKGYAKLVDDETEIDVETGAKAAVQLHKLLRADEESGALRVAEMVTKLNRIITLVEEFVPEERRAEFAARLERLERGEEEPMQIEAGQTLEAEIEDDEEEFDPDIEADDDEDDF